MMLRYIMSFCLVFSLLPMRAQVIIDPSMANQVVKLSKDSTLDVSRVECIYQHIVSDPVLERSEEWYDILQLGSLWSKYMDYNEFRTDSVLNTLDRKKLTVEEYTNLYNLYFPSRSANLLHNMKTGDIEVRERTMGDNFVYQDSVSIGWQLSDETKEVCGQKCSKATCHFRGRNWVAWYADVPVSLGPWKFSGLPGLILQLEDDKREHVFRAIALRKGVSPIVLKEKRYIPTTRQRYEKVYRDERLNPGTALLGSGRVVGNVKPQGQSRLFYNPIELE